MRIVLLPGLIFFLKCYSVLQCWASDLRKSLPCRARELNLSCMTGSGVLMFMWCGAVCFRPDCDVISVREGCVLNRQMVQSNSREPMQWKCLCIEGVCVCVCASQRMSSPVYNCTGCTQSVTFKVCLCACVHACLPASVHVCMCACVRALRVCMHACTRTCARMPVPVSE